MLSFAQKTDLFFWGSLKNAKEMIFVHFFFCGHKKLAFVVWHFVVTAFMSVFIGPM